jgi:hypothetical protein
VATFEQALSLEEATVGRANPRYANTLGCLAAALGECGDGRARQVAAEATALRRACFGSSHPSVANALVIEARLAERAADHDVARKSYVEAVRIRRDLIRRLFPSMTADERELYLEESRGAIEVFVQYALGSHRATPDVLGDLYDVQLITKALLLQGLVEARGSMATAEQPQAQELYHRWLASRRELAGSGVAGGALTTAEAKAKWRAIAELEKDLAIEASELGEHVPEDDVDWRTVQSRLLPGDAAVEIVRVWLAASEEGYWAYVALVLRPDARPPQLVELGRADQLEGEALRGYFAALEAIVPGPFVDYWAPLGPLLAGARRIYVSPDGVYSQLDLNVLFDPDAGQFLADSIDIRVLASTRNVASRAEMAPVIGSAVLVGRPSFDSFDPDEWPDRGISDVRPSNNAFADLPGTEREVLALLDVLRGAGWSVEICLGEAATRSALNAIKHPTVLHIATHGFVRSPDEVWLKHDTRGLVVFAGAALEDSPGKQALFRVLAEAGYATTAAPLVRASQSNEAWRSDPWLRNGLALAGANLALEATGFSPGLFTGLDMMNLELQGTALVVLSACDSGRGEIQAGEGAFGCARALRAAGARTILATLWSVDDTISANLTLQFYSSWLGGNDAWSALREAQRLARQRFKLPLLWGGFVLVE